MSLTFIDKQGGGRRYSASDCTVTAEQELYVVYGTLGGLTSASHFVLGGGDVLEVDVPATIHVVRHDELGSGRLALSLYCNGSVLNLLVFLS